MVAHPEDEARIDRQSTESYERTTKDDLAVPKAIAPSAFYGTGENPFLPQRRSTIGSSYTRYRSPTPKRYEQNIWDGNGWREPENVTSDDDIPDLIPPDSTNLWNSTRTWADENVFSDVVAGGVKAIEIDGRDLREEREWWDQDIIIHRPGPGMLPPMMESKLHNTEHTLFTVSVTPPDLKPNATISPDTPSSSPSRPSQLLNSSSPPAPHPVFTPPTPEEVREAIPHPNAHYCRKHNGWILLAIHSSRRLPQASTSFLSSSPRPWFPDQHRRGRVKNCLQDQPFGRYNKTHHFHEYLRCADAKHLMQPYRMRTWEKEERAKCARRKVEFGTHDDLAQYAAEGDLKNLDSAPIATKSKEDDDPTILLDMYICCQCSLYVAVSEVIPGVIPVKYVDSLTSDKYQNPIVGWNGASSVMAAWETIITAIENLLWRGISKPLKIGGKMFSKKLGWSSAILKIFESVGFTFRDLQPEESVGTLIPPSVDASTSLGALNRERLLRAWVEIGSFVEEYRRRYADELLNYQFHPLWVKIDSARETHQRELGAHIEQIPRGPLPDFLSMVPQSVKNLWSTLGLSSTAYDADLFQFAYYAQCRCDPRNTKKYFTAVVEIDNRFQVKTDYSQNETMIAEERSRGRFTESDVQESVSMLGFGNSNVLQLEYDENVEDEFILCAWKDKIRRSWSAYDGACERKDLAEALRIIAHSRGSRELIAALEYEERNGMTPEKAYATLEVPEAVDEEILITIFSMRVEEQPSQADKMREALRVIAESTESERLQKFLETGMDPGDSAIQSRPDWPRGLNQLGNTCYLNSLLQYFYTIKDLRDAIAPLALSNNDKLPFEDRVDDDDLKKHRVGGRAITRSEVVRSRKFVSHLAELFGHLEHSTNAAVTPSLDLAKLALVTSKDEEEDETDRGGTESSNSTDATLVDESAGGLRESPQPQRTHQTESDTRSLSRSPSSVLGKRTRGVDKTAEGEDQLSGDGASTETRSADSDGFILVSEPGTPSPAGSEPSGSEPPVTIDADGDGDIEMQTAENAEPEKAPPLPPRPKTQGTSEMMFGRQHDVAECMDNCMFQIETALLNFGAPLEVSDNDKTSVVKRLFYGKMRQRLTLLDESKNHKSSMHEREDRFAHLPVNVSDELFDLYDGLGSYFDDVVEFNGAKAKMEVSLIELPPVLQIQLQRVQFDRETMQAYKSHTYVKFDETIVMDRFMDDAPVEKKAAAKAIQDELNQKRERIRQLSKSKYESLNKTRSFLTTQSAITLEEVDEDFLHALEADEDQARKELESCRVQTTDLKEKLEEVWADQRNVEYELTAVFVHRGASPTFGHYFIYQRWLPDQPDKWFKYNDAEVSEVHKDEVLADTTGSTANPYLLVYTKKDSQVIQTVQRADVMQE